MPADIEKELFMYNWADYVDTGACSSSSKSLASRSSPRHVRATRRCWPSYRPAVGQYDFGAPTAEYTPGMVEEGMIQKIDWSKIPNQKYINSQFKKLCGT